MRTQRFLCLVFITMIVFGFIATSNLNFAFLNNSIIAERKAVIADSNTVYFNDTVPVIDGDLSSYDGEWANATIYNTYFGEEEQKPVTIMIKANTTHLFIAVNYTTALYTHINTTIPTGEDYNNQTHNWYAIVFDTNYDKKVGSELTPDDVVLVNYRYEGAQDGYINGTSGNGLVLDESTNGFNNSIGVLNQTLNDLQQYEVVIEIAKELHSGDNNGHDIELYQNDGLWFTLLAFENKTALYDSELLSEVQTSWLSFKMERLYDVFSYVSDLSTLNVTVLLSSTKFTDAENLSSIANLIALYNLNVTTEYLSDYTVKYGNLADDNLVILAGSGEELSKDEVDALRFYLASGGSLLVLGDAISKDSKINDLLSYYNITLYNSSLVSKDIALNDSFTIPTSGIVQVTYTTETLVLTNNSIGTINYQGTAVNFTGPTGEAYYQFQEGDLYPYVNATGDYYIDLDNDMSFNKTNDIELNNTATVAATLELQRGGKLIVWASGDIYNSSMITYKAHKTMLLREASWLLNLQFRIHYEDFTVQETEVNYGDSIHVNITVYTDENNTLNDVKVWAVAQELKSDIHKEYLTAQTDGKRFNGTLTMEPIKAAYLDVTVRMHKRGYGYNETGLFEVKVLPESRLNLSVNGIAIIIFLISLGLAAIATIAVKNYKPIEEVEQENKTKAKTTNKKSNNNKK